MPRLPAAAMLLVPLTVAAVCCLESACHRPAPAPSLLAGVAEIDITPAEPIRLSGYASRRTPSEGVRQRLRAKALAIKDRHDGSLSLLVTVDAIGIPGWLTDELAARLEVQTRLPRSHLVVCASHTHAAPQLKGCIPFMFDGKLPPGEREVIDRYTDGLLDKLEQVSLEALTSFHPARLDWGKGEVRFAGNRRVLEDGKWTGFGTQPDGPVDHSLPLLRVTTPEGALTAVFLNYACHCTTTGGNVNEIHADWAGFAQEEIEKRHPGSLALVAIGCGADQNPDPRGELAHARQHGATIATEVDRLLASPLHPLPAGPRGTLGTITLAFDPLPTREEWTARAQEGDRGSGFAQAMLDTLDRGGEIPATMPYPVQAWSFGDDLAMLFLPGEVVVDYAHRFYREYDPGRLWINAYSNDLPCYIASRRLYDEGGYEVDYSMNYYGMPTRLAPDTEARIAAEVRRQLPHAFHINN